MNEPFFGNNPRQRQQKGLNIESNDPFYLTHSPQQWELAEDEKGKFEFLPQFGKLIEMAGCNGVESVKGGVDSVMARAELRERGVVVLPLELGYMTRYPTKKGGWYYTLKWNSPKEIANRVISKMDKKAWDNFRRELVTTGILDPIDPDLVDIMIHDISREKESLIVRQHIPEVKLEMSKIDQKIKNMKLALSKSKKGKK